ncbi:MAG: cyclic nucleotide-binding domain-containing protein [Verrucomicrobia bacterium]|nr:cyclic nucleotide-binding domain-containing protein [Verrucomicrobiota bacterium]
MRKVLFIFGELNDFDIDWMIATGRKEQVPSGGVLIQEGKPVSALYIVLDGAFKVTVAKLRNAEIARLGAGEIVGEMSFVEARPPSATVTATESSVLLSIPRTKLAAKLKQDTGFAARFYRALAVFLSNRLRKTVSQLGYGKARPEDEEEGTPDELDTNVLDNVHLAGARFDRMVKRVMGS